MGFLSKLFSQKQENDLDAAIKSGQVTVGSNFQLSCPFHLTGPGRLEIGNNVVVKPSFWDEQHLVTFTTYHADAVIRIGDNTVLEGTRMGCRVRLDIGSDCYIGETSILDTDFHSLDYMDRDGSGKVQASPVTIEDGVRVSCGCHILRGVTIGKKTVVRPMSIVSQSLPGGIVAFGSPAMDEEKITVT